MALTVAELQGLLTLDDRQFRQGMGGASRSMRDLRDTGQQTSTGLQGTFRKLAVVIGATFVASKIKDFAKQSINAAASLEQAVGGTEAVFGEARGAIDDFAKDSARNVGLSKSAFRDLTTVAGAQLKNLGFSVDEAADKSIQLTQIGADLAATYGGTTKEAVEALGAAFRGEADPAERFGLRLNINTANAKAVELGLAETTSAVDDHARAQAILALVMEQSADAQGQFAREGDTLAGQQQRLSAQWEDMQARLGEKLLPILSAVAGVLGTVLANDALLAAAGIGAVAGAALLALPHIRDIRDAVKALGLDFSGLGRRLAGGGLVVGGLFAVKEALDAVFGEVGPQAADLAKLETGLRKFGQTGKATGELAKVAGDDLAKLRAAFQTLDDPSLLETAQDKVDSFAEKVSFGLVDGATEAEKAKQAFEDIDQVLAGLAASDPARAFDILKLASEGTGISVDDLKGKLPEYADAVDAAKVAAEDAGVPTDEFGRALGGAGDAADEAAEAVDELNQAIDDFVERSLSVEEAADRLTLALFDANEHFKTQRDELGNAGLALDGHSEAAARNRDVLRGLVEDGAGVIQSMIDQGASSGELRAEIDRQKERLRTLAARYGLNQDVVGRYIGVLDAIPTTKSTTISVRGVKRSRDLINAIRRDLERLPRFRDISIRSTHRIVGATSTGPQIGHAGGVVAGPAGQEVLAILQAGERVLPMDDPLNKALTGAAAASLASTLPARAGGDAGMGAGGGGGQPVDVRFVVGGNGGWLGEAVMHSVRTGETQLFVNGDRVRVS